MTQKTKIKTNNKFEYRNFETEFRMNEDRSSITGLAIVYNQESRNLGGFVETIAPSALDNADVSDVMATYNHNANQLLGRSTSGTLMLQNTERGLEFNIKIPDTSYAKDLMVLMERNDVKASSFAFVVAAGGETWHKDNGKYFRTITKIGKLVDVSVVNNPAYTQTSATLRAFEDAKIDLDKVVVVVDEKSVKRDTKTLNIYTRHLKLKIKNKTSK